VRKEAALVCAFCGARVVHRLEPGTLCTSGQGGFCPEPAESLCRACGQPLCDRHNDPRRIYWHAGLDWSVLCPDWSGADRSEWARLNVAPPRFPVADIEPSFEWRRFEKDSRQSIGTLEFAVLEAIRPVAQRWSGDSTEMGCVFDGVCAECVTEAEAALSEVVSGYVVRYRQVALRDRLAGLRAECEQGLRYITDVLGRTPADSVPGEDSLPPLDTLDASSPRRDWDRWAIRLKERLGAIDRFAARVARCGSPETAGAGPQD
jgi:hypothetical protein